MFLDLAPNTVRKYASSFNKWVSWAKGKGCKLLPAEPSFLALFLTLQIKSCNSSSAFNSIVSSISWAHRKVGFSTPIELPVVKQVVIAGRRILGKSPINRKLPLKREHLIDLFHKFYYSDLGNIQILTLITLGFFAFLRWDDLTQIKIGDIKFYHDHAAIFLEKRKNDQYREGSWVYLSRFDGFNCPVALVERFVLLGGHIDGSPLFRKISHTRNGYSLREQKLSYSRARELVRGQLAQIGLNPDKYGLHSLRSGGASEAAATGVPDRQLMRHGGWRSESSKNRYIKETSNSLLSVSRALKLQ